MWQVQVAASPGTCQAELACGAATGYKLITCALQAVARQREHLCGACVCDYVRGKPRNVARTQGLIGRGDSVLAAVSGGAHAMQSCMLLNVCLDRLTCMAACRAMLSRHGACPARHAEQKPAAS